MDIKKQLKMAKKQVSKAKAKKILKDVKVRGKPLTKKQRGFFGARSGGKRKWKNTQSKHQ